jgi:hypothetical protein
MKIAFLFLPNVSWLYPWVMYHICPHSPHYHIFYDLVFNVVLTFENYIIHTYFLLVSVWMQELGLGIAHLEFRGPNSTVWVAMSEFGNCLKFWAKSTMCYFSLACFRAAPLWIGWNCKNFEKIKIYKKFKNLKNLKKKSEKFRKKIINHKK